MKKVYWIISGVLLILFITFRVIYQYTTCEWLLLLCIFTVLVLSIISVVYFAIAWSRHIENLMKGYKRNNIISGELAVLLAFLFVISLLFSQFDEYVAVKDFFKGLSSLIIAAIPAIMGLFGVQYSVAIQERNRKEDLRLGSKPFFSVYCFMESLIADEFGHSVYKAQVNVTLKNISKNIGILNKLISLDDDSCEIDLNSVPVASNEKYCNLFTISSVEPYKSKARIAIYYDDIYKNTYKIEVEFFLHKNENLAKTHIVSDEQVIEQIEQKNE